MSKKVFIGNLNYSTTERDLAAALADAGEITEIFLPIDRISGRPRGFAFVEFSNEDQAKAAIEKFDGHEVNGRPLRINLAEDRPRRGPGGPPGGAPGGGGGPGGFGGGGGYEGGGGGGGGGGGAAGRKGRAGKPKGSRRGQRGKKRSL